MHSKWPPQLIRVQPGFSLVFPIQDTCFHIGQQHLPLSAVKLGWGALRVAVTLDLATTLGVAVYRGAISLFGARILSGDAD